MLLTRDAILGSDDLKPEKVATPEWGESAFVYVRGLDGLERGSYEHLMGTMSKPERYRKTRGLLCTYGICDEAGKPIFTADDVDRLSVKSAAPLDRCFDRIYSLSGMGAAESIEKNSEPTPGEDA